MSESSASLRARRVLTARFAPRRVLVGGALVGVALALLGLGFAGSRTRLPEGVAIAGIDVGGLSASQAVERLERRGAAAAAQPVVFTVGAERYPIRAGQLGVEPNWRAAVEKALEGASGFGPVRGYKRIRTRFLGEDLQPPISVYGAALDYKVGQLSADIDRAHVEARLARRGLEIEVVPGQSGRRLNRAAAKRTIVSALGRLSRGAPVALPVEVAPPEVTPRTLARAARDARTALSAPVRLIYGETRWRLPRWRIAQLLSLPQGGATRLAIAGPAAEAWFEQLAESVGTEPVDAGFAVAGEHVTVVPHRPGITVDVPRTAKALLAAAVSPVERVAALSIREALPQRTTDDARAMGVTERLSSYSTAYAGTSARIRNLQLAVAELDGTLVAPGAEFSFNETVGERTVERGFRPAPVIISGEYGEDVGGGVSQVATTVFNAAWEAGLKITERNPHALYISRYQLGRDATVNYPDLDLKFVNDTEKWVLVRGGYDDYGINISIYGTSDRRVESSPGTVRITGPAPVRREPDPTLERGKTEVAEEGTQARATSVVRKIYEGDTLLREETWPTYYRGEYRVIRVGTKSPEKPKDEAKKGKEGTKPPAPPGETGATTTSPEPSPPPARRTP